MNQELQIEDVHLGEGKAVVKARSSRRNTAAR